MLVQRAAGTKSCYRMKDSKPLVSEGGLGTRTQLQCDLCQMPPDNQVGGKPHGSGGSHRYSGACLDSVLDGWGKQVMRDPSHLQASTLSQHPLEVPDCPSAFPGAFVSSSFTSSLKSCCTNICKRESGGTAITFFMFFEHFLFYLLLAGWLSSPGEGPMYDRKRRCPMGPHRDSRRWVIRIWSLPGNKVAWDFIYSPSQSARA